MILSSPCLGQQACPVVESDGPRELSLPLPSLPHPPYLGQQACSVVEGDGPRELVAVPHRGEGPSSLYLLLGAGKQSEVHHLV